ncbi:MAG: hypothetical protein RLZZ524_973 [Pseudomonadota bacterium]
MRLPSFLQRQQAARSGNAAGRGAVPQDDAAIEQLRVRARHRLIGAAVLVVLAVVLLPMVFESKPRPVSGPIAIEGVRSDGAAPVVVAPATSPSSSPSPAPASAPVASTPPAPAPDPAPVPVPVPAPPAVATVPPATRPASAAAPADPIAAFSEPTARKPVEKATEKPASKPEAPKPASPKPEPPKPEPPKADTPKADGVRYAVQVGAFAEAAAVRDTRAKLDKLGLRSSVQTVDTANGPRTRVRIGPYATREEADKAAAQLRAAGLPGMIVPQ